MKSEANNGFLRQGQWSGQQNWSKDEKVQAGRPDSSVRLHQHGVQRRRLPEKPEKH